MIIYRILNKINGKFYVGKTTKTLDERFNKHIYNHQKVETYLYKAMRKYGHENFNIEVLEEDVIDLNEREKFWINFLKPEYNMTEGGDGGDTSNSPKFKESMEKHHSNRTYYPGSRMTGKNHSEETKNIQSIRRKEHWDSLTEENREARSKKVSGSKNGMFGKTPKNSVRIVYKGILYNSLSAASKDTGLSTKFIKKHGELYYERNERSVVVSEVSAAKSGRCYSSRKH